MVIDICYKRQERLHECRCDLNNLLKDFYNVNRDIHNQKLTTTNYKGGLFCCQDNVQCK